LASWVGIKLVDIEQVLRYKQFERGAQNTTAEPNQLLCFNSKQCHREHKEKYDGS